MAGAYLWVHAAMSHRKYLYWDWVRQEARFINSDGCTDVPDFHRDCCLQHDLAYHYGRNPRSAYQRYIRDVKPKPKLKRDIYWSGATAFTRAQADKQLRQCIQDDSPFGKWDLMSWWRWLGVRLFGRKHWNASV